MGKIRTFIAVDVADERLKQQFAEFQKRLLDAGADAKLVTPENMHLTLRFLGEIDEDILHEVTDAMNLVDFQSFNIRFKGVGAFPSLNRINVVWVGIREGDEELAKIAERLEPKLRAIGIPSDKKGFSPHLTVARVRTGRNKDRIAELISELNEKDFGSMRAESITLKKSVLTPSGPIYSTIFEVKA